MPFRYEKYLFSSEIIYKYAKSVLKKCLIKFGKIETLVFYHQDFAPFYIFKDKQQQKYNKNKYKIKILQILLMLKQNKINSGYFPKGSYHTYCKNRLEQQHKEMYTFIKPNFPQSQTFHVMQRKIQTTNTNRRFLQSQNKQTNRNIGTSRLLDHANGLTFEEYLASFEKSKENQKDRAQFKSKSARTQKQCRSKSSKKQKRINRKIDNQEIIDSHLPFFKAKLEKTEPLIRNRDKGGFRIRENKFKLNHNVIELQQLGGFMKFQDSHESID